MARPLEVQDLVLYAYKLAILTFYIGVLVIALPLPISKVKRWGPELLWDGASALLIAVTYLVLYEASNIVGALLGGSWAAFNAWYSQATSVILALKGSLAALKGIPEFMGVKSSGLAVLSPLDRASTLALLLLVTIGGISYLVTKFGLFLLAVGAVLYSVPFRLARGAGAWLIAFILVFNVGIQVLPVFLASVASPPDISEESVPSFNLVSVKVSAGGFPASNGVLRVVRGGETVGIYPLDYNGNSYSLSTGGNLVAVPESGLAEFILEYDGVAFYLYPRPVDLSSLQVMSLLELRQPDIVFIKPPFIVGFVSGGSASLEAGDGGYVVSLELEEGGYFELRYPEICPASLDPGGGMETESGGWEWRGIRGAYIKAYSRAGGNYSLTVRLSECEAGITPEMPDYTDYLVAVASQLRFLKVNILEAFILYYLTVPGIYLFVLFIATAGLARLIGGRDRIPVKVV